MPVGDVLTADDPLAPIVAVGGGDPGRPGPSSFFTVVAKTVGQSMRRSYLNDTLAAMVAQTASWDFLTSLSHQAFARVDCKRQCPIKK